MVERRGENRNLAKGEVRFTLDAAASVEFAGRLIDSSNRGFRASHSHKGLSTGQQVHFRHSLGDGYAVVVWNRILDRDIESGFVILDK